MAQRRHRRDDDKQIHPIERKPPFRRRFDERGDDHQQEECDKEIKTALEEETPKGEACKSDRHVGSASRAQALRQGAPSAPSRGEHSPISLGSCVRAASLGSPHCAFS